MEDFYTQHLVEKLEIFFKYNKPKNNGNGFDKSGLEYRKASVLIPFVYQDSEWHVLFTRRSDSLRNHKGQVSFPGGALDPSDQTPFDAALRETYEEIGVESRHINILGAMSTMVTNTNFVVTPVVAVMDWPVKLRLSVTEVSRVFTIPFSWLADPANWEERVYNHPSGWYGSVIFYEKFDGELLWGISAAIMHRIIEIVADSRK